MNLLTKCKEIFNDARQSIFNGIVLLHTISTEKLWEGSYSSFGEFCEQELQLHPTQASRYLKAYEHYVIQGKVEFSQLKSVNPERLYLAASLNGSPEEQLVRAQNWTVEEIRLELREQKVGKHEHDWYELHLRQCKTCSLREKI